MRRREFITLLGSAAAAWPLAARAQQPELMRRIGVLMGYAAGDIEGEQQKAAFEQGLRELGLLPSQALRIDYRWGGGDAERFRAFAAELVAARPEVIIAHSTTALRPLLRETAAIPLIFVNVADPVGQGFVKSLSRPGANVTGFTNFEFSMGEKWLEYLKEVAPSRARVAILFNPNTAPYFRFFLAALVRASAFFGMQVTGTPVFDVAAIDAAMAASAHDGSVIVLPDVFLSVNREQIAASAIRNRVPVMYPFGFFARGNGLMSYGSDTTDLFRRAATYVDRVLKGAAPAELPVQAPVKFEFIINLKTAKALGLEIPPKLLALADEVIE